MLAIYGAYSTYQVIRGSHLGGAVLGLLVGSLLVARPRRNPGGNRQALVAGRPILGRELADRDPLAVAFAGHLWSTADHPHRGPKDLGDASILL